MNNLERDCSETEKQEIRVDVKSVKVAWPRSKQEPFVCRNQIRMECRNGGASEMACP